MDRQDSDTDFGMVRIHKNVIASISAVAATEIEGIKRVGSDFQNNLLEMIGIKSYHAIKVEFDKHEEVKINLPLVIKYGFNIPQVALKVQENVRNALEKMTNLTIKEINIRVKAIERG